MSHLKKENSYERRSLKKVRYPLSVFLIIFFMGMAVYLIYDSIMSGVVFVGGKAGPVKRYSLAEQPGMFWFSIFMYAVLIVIAGAFLRVMRLLAKSESQDAE